MGRVARGTVGTAQAAGHLDQALACAFPGVQEPVELPLAQLGNRSAVLNGGYRIGDQVASLIAWESNGADIARGDVGVVLDSGREEKGLVVSFPRMRRISIMLTQVGRIGMPLNGGYSLGEKVVSLINWSGAAGNLTEGDVGVVLASGNGGKGVVADFPNIQNLNIMLHQITKAQVALSPAVPLEQPQQEPAAPKDAQNKVHGESNGQASAQVGHEQKEQERRSDAAAPAGGPAPAADDAEALALAANGTFAPASAAAAPSAGDGHAAQEVKAGAKEPSSLRQKLAKAKRRASLAKKLEKAKANRGDSQRETAPVKRHLVQPDAWPADQKSSLLSRLMGPLLGKNRPSDDEVAALSLAQTGIKLSKKPLLSGVKRRHEEF